MILLVAVAATMAVAVPGAAVGPPATVGDPGPAAHGATDVPGDTNVTEHNVTLISGQTVTVVRRGNDTEYRVAPGADLRKVSTPEGTYFFPEHVDLDRVDPALFNVDRLVEQNLTDGESDTIPVIVQRTSEDEDAAFTATSVQEANREFRSGLRRTDGVRTERTLDIANSVSADVEKSGTAETFEAIRSDDDVAGVYLDQRVSVTLENATERVSAAQARAEHNVSGRNVTVAVLDTGIDATHPDLNGSVVHAADFTGEGIENDPFGHGTHVAGIVAGDGTASNGTYVGVAPNASLINLRVLDDDGGGEKSDVIAAMEYAVNDTDADVVSMSLGWPAQRDDPFYGAVENAVENNVTVVASAGNEGRYGRSTIGSPGVVPAAITVGASTDADTLTDFSSRGPTADRGLVKPNLVAPGHEVTSAEAGTDGYVSHSGTSMSAPMVSGTAALLLADNPDWSPTELRSALVATTDRLNDSYDVYETGTGRLNATAALSTDLVVNRTTTDFGDLEPNAEANRTVEFTNLRNESRTLNLTASVTGVTTNVTGNVTLNQTTLSLGPGETGSVEITVNASTTEDFYSGRIRVEGGEYRAIFGYTTRSELTVRKADRNGTEVGVEGDYVVLVSHDTESVSLLTVSNGTAKQRLFSGNYTVISPGYDESNGYTPILMGDVVTVDGDTTLSLYENESVAYTVDPSAIENGTGRLANLTVGGELQNTLPSGQSLDIGTLNFFADSRTVRFGQTQAMNASVSYLLAPSSRYGSDSDYHLDVPVAYHLVYPTVGISSFQTWTPDNATLAAQNATYHRTDVGQSYYVRHDMTHRLYPTSSSRMIYLSVEDRADQTLYVSPSTSSHRVDHRVEAIVGGDWYSQARSHSISPGERRQVAVGKQPVVGSQAHWRLRNDSTADNVSLWTYTQLDQHPTRFVRDSRTGYYVYRNSTEVANGSTADGMVGYTSDAELVDGTRYAVTLLGSNPYDRLGTSVVTRLAATYQRGSDNAPPRIAAVEAPGAGQYNNLTYGGASLRVTVEDGNMTNGSVIVRYANASVTDAPYDGSLANTSANWTEANVTVSSADAGAVTYEATVDTSTVQTERLHLDVVAVDEAGNVRESLVENAYNVGPVGGAYVSGSVKLPSGDAAVGDEVVAVDDSGRVVDYNRTTASGDYRLTVDRNETVTVGYLQYNESTGAPFPADGSVDLAAIERVNASTHTDLGRTALPEANELGFAAVNESGGGVPHAEVSLSVETDGVTYEQLFAVGANGSRPVDGLELAGNATLVVSPPPGADAYVSQTYTETVRMDGDRNITVVLDEASVAPRVNVSASSTTVSTGEPVEFTATGAPATVVQHKEWTFGDGAAAVGTGASVTHSYDESGEYAVELAAVDGAGNVGTATVNVTVESESIGGGGAAPPQNLEDPLGMDASVSTALDGATVSIVRGEAGGSASADLPSTAAVDGVSFDELDVTLAAENREFDLEVAASNQSPDGVTAFDDRATLGYLSVEKSDVTNDDIANATIAFTVAEEGLPDGASLDDVSLYHYANGSWEELPTERNGTAFTAETDGFSAFAVGVARADVDVTGASVDPSAVGAGESVTVTATVANDGSLDGSETVSLTADGETLASTNVSVAAGETRTVEFDVTLDDPGSVELAVGDVDVGEVSVSAATETTASTTAAAADADSDSDGQAGFGVTVALAALLTGTLLARRR
ncbi:S8 family serine peptidase [Halostella sp. JP-L12]|uniref:S8 family serine peptidase n=2 Tax=Halostella TaxID=1843185 RepID=UPI00140A37EA|nr:S8 family serine peptidase [Halostella sp. JP-L12]NHN49628.1 S8 family serine peptidase [Halostella sp. JP-L12]